MATKKIDLDKIRQMTVAELKQKEQELGRHLLDLRIKRANNQLKNLVQLRTMRRDRARVLTIINEKEKKGGESIAKKG